MVVPSERLAVDCYANPCTQARSVCSPAGQCTVHPLTRAVADVKAEACVRLLRDKWTLCRGRQGDALTACQDAVDEATSRDDEAACAKARASLSP